MAGELIVIDKYPPRLFWRQEVLDLGKGRNVIASNDIGSYKICVTKKGDKLGA